ncbi:8821_t:CDS:2 [Paraglomus occultum]|uniref:8821_t:CDS:1 n=1 Tax=Paraglomus occultum TaxID=144539 RepID=A0A9N9C0U6_9GLOM|nr:8821_t:CDS:2 [Paraglomus occultum]
MPTPATQKSNAKSEESNKKHGSRAPPKPNDKAFKVALEENRAKIDKLQEQLDKVNEKINNEMNNDPIGRKRDELKKQLDEIREKQALHKQARSSTFEKIKVLNDALNKKKRDVKVGKDKMQFRTVKDIDIHIQNLERQVESGELKIIEEKRIISEISNLKKAKKTVEQFEIQQTSIDADQKAIDDIKKTLQDTDSRQLSAEYDKIKAELDLLYKNQSEQHEKRQKLFDERKRLKSQRDAEYERKNALYDNYNKAKQQYYEWFDEKKAEDEAAQLASKAQQLREEAALPAFEAEILICNNLINFFQTSYGINKTAVEPASVTFPATLNIRAVDTTANVPEGVMLVKKEDRDDDYFVGNKETKKKRNKHEKKNQKNNSCQLDISIMDQLYQVDVAVPTSVNDIEKTVEALIAKKQYYIDNQERITEENIEKVEAKIAAMKTDQPENGKKTNVEGGDIKKSAKVVTPEASAATETKEEVK